MPKVNYKQSREELQKVRRCRAMVEKSGIEDAEKRRLKLQMTACLKSMMISSR